MMRIDIITVMPEALESPLHCSILQRAQDKGLVEFHVHNLRDWSLRPHRKVDDYPFFHLPMFAENCFYAAT